ncbi:hypothetical protein G3I67_10265 [Orrella sp. NBD-18]|uniref:Uncharacterized protein n=1 Tax=Sheuella amnicola TaxID=2707330 RepID=A0A6B2QYC7_9BURK|nr:hypothetical protein [Sheuella amnicola]NDY83616.1 hypothetical protein [Sheuella amnicola]HBI82506.1 hypothetical protein [Alcaligenaceae bacterium]
MKWRSLMWILWPSFLMAGMASAVVFALIDPLDVAIFGYLRPQREVLYAAGFFFFWFICALSSLLSLYIVPQPGDDRNDIGF